MLMMDRSRTGRKGPYAGYYLQIAPGGKSWFGKYFFGLSLTPYLDMRLAPTFSSQIILQTKVQDSQLSNPVE